MVPRTAIRTTGNAETSAPRMQLDKRSPKKQSAGEGLGSLRKEKDREHTEQLMPEEREMGGGEIQSF